MEKFTKLTSKAIPFPRRNVDTDLIIPARFLKTTKRSGLGEGAFAAIRHLNNGSLDPDCVFNQDAYAGAKILITGDNFGCGSSREHAAWALVDLGIKVILAPSFADIFASNAFKNGILTITLEQNVIDKLLVDAKKDEIGIDLEEQKIIVPNQHVISFDYDPFKKHCMLEGLDEIGLTLSNQGKIEAFEAKQRNISPWLYS
jgi:3-isopropylmalate dehydratase small subunit